MKKIVRIILILFLFLLLVGSISTVLFLWVQPAV